MRWNFASLFLVAGLTVAASVSVPTEVAAQKKASLNVVETFDVDEQKDGTYVRIKGSSVPTFSVFKLTAPLRLFVDVSNSELGADAKSIKVNNGVVSQVSLLEFKDSAQSVTRVIIGFDKAAHYDVRTDGHDVVVYVDGSGRSKQRPMANFADELKKRDDTIAQTKKQLENLERQYESKLSKNNQKIDQSTQALSATKSELKEKEAQLAQLREQLKQSSGSEKTKVSKAIAQKNSEISKTKQELNAQKKKLASLGKDLDKLKRERSSDRKKLAALQKKAEQSQKERDSALALARQKEKEGKQAAVRAQTLERNLAATQTNLKSAQTRVEASKQKVAQRTKELKEARQRELALEQEIAALKNQSASKAKISEATKRKETIRASALKKEKELAEAKANAKAASAEMASMRSKLNSRDAEIVRLKKQIAVAKREANLAEKERAKAMRLAVDREKSRLSQLETNPNGRVAKAVPVDPTNAVKGIRLETENGKSRIVVELDRPSQFQTLPSGSSRAVMILNDVELPDGLEKTLANGSEGGAVRFVSSYKDPQGRVRLEAELSGDAKEFVKQDGNKLVWEFAPSMLPQGTNRDLEFVQNRPKTGKSFTSAPPRYPRVVVDPTQVSSVPGMRRKRLTIDLREADIQNVLRLIAKEGGVNIVSGEGVDGTVTMRLKSVPLDEVFLTVLQSRNLGFEKRGNVIRVAPQEVLRTEEAARAQARQEAVDRKPLEVFLLPINYAQAGDLENQVSGLLSPRGTVSVDERTNTLVIKDIPENLAAVRALVTNLDSQVPQVLIEARIVETNDTFQQQIGIQWGGDLSFSQANGNPTGLVFPSNVGIAGGATDGQTPTAGTSPNPNFAVNLPAAAGTGSGGALGLALGSVGGALNINLRLSALEAAGHAKIVSAPKILTLDNTDATISQGTSIPISVVGAAGVQTVFVDATLELAVRPHVTPDGNVQLRIQATKNEPDFQNTGARGDPTIIRKEATTELLVKDGDTTVIGGIYTRNSGSAVAAVPFFHKIPVLGFFFRTQQESDRRTELLIFITPKIVNRAESLGSVSTGEVQDGFKRPEGEQQ